jgi:hypothetical protein
MIFLFVIIITSKFTFLVPVVAFCNLNHFDYNFAKEDLINVTKDQLNQNQTASDYAWNIRRHIRYNLIKKYLNVKKSACY